MKRILAILLTVCLFAALAACGGTAPTQPPQNSEPAPASAPEPTAAPAEVHPYAWLGLEDMPECTYLDLLASQHYIREIDIYDGSYVTQKTEASDGLNAYTRDANLALNLEGMVYTFNDRQMIYMTFDATDLYESGLTERANHVEQGINEFGRQFQTTGSESVPLYAEQSGDTAEYEYYEYLTDLSSGDTANKQIERFYMKDGDVFAIYKLAVTGGMETALTEVIKSCSGDIPEGTFALPANFDEYKLYE